LTRPTLSTFSYSSATQQVVKSLGAILAQSSVSIPHIQSNVFLDHAAMVLKFGSEPQEVFFMEATGN